VITAQTGSKITVTNGTLQGNGQNYGVAANGAEVVLNRVVMKEVAEGIKVIDHQNDRNADSRVHIVDSEIVATEDGLWIYGNNGSSDTKTTVIVERSLIQGNSYAGILCNGSYMGTDIQIFESTVNGYYAAVYHPQKNSTLQISDSQLEGQTGLVVKGGVVKVENSVIRGIATAEEIEEPTYKTSGFSGTGDGIYLEANYEWTAEIYVSGAQTRVTSQNAQAVRKFMSDELGAVISIEGGTYSTDVSAYLATGATQTMTTDGRYIVNP
jgi:hypothetical protein